MYCGHFALLHASLRLLSSAGSLHLSNFWPKMAKNRGFLKILGQKNFFVPSFRTFYCGSFEPSYSYAPLPIEACSPDELAAPPPAPQGHSWSPVPRLTMLTSFNQKHFKIVNGRHYLVNYPKLFNFHLWYSEIVIRLVIKVHTRNSGS